MLGWRHGGQAAAARPAPPGRRRLPARATPVAVGIVDARQAHTQQQASEGIAAVAKDRPQQEKSDWLPTGKKMEVARKKGSSARPDLPGGGQRSGNRATQQLPHSPRRRTRRVRSRVANILPSVHSSRPAMPLVHTPPGIPPSAATIHEVGWGAAT